MAKQIQFISRLPANFKICNELKDKAWQKNWTELGKFGTQKNAAEYLSQSFEAEINGNRLRCLVVHSTSLEARKLKALEKRLAKDKTTLESEAKQAFKTGYACEPDAQKALVEFIKNFKHPVFPIQATIETVTVQKYAKRGKPGKDTPKIIQTTYHVKIAVGDRNNKAYEILCKQESTFVLVTNLLNEVSHPDSTILGEYKEQWQVKIAFVSSSNQYQRKWDAWSTA